MRRNVPVTCNRHIEGRFDELRISSPHQLAVRLFWHVSMGGFHRFSRYIYSLVGYSTNARLSTVRFVLYQVLHKCNYGSNNALRPIFQ